jgi:ribulose kinase
LREHADATQCRVVVAQEPESVLLGAAVLGAVASGDQPTVLAAMGAMSGPGQVIEPRRGKVADYHEAKHRVFMRMIEDQLAYREIMK